MPKTWNVPFFFLKIKNHNFLEHFLKKFYKKYDHSMFYASDSGINVPEITFRIIIYHIPEWNSMFRHNHVIHVKTLKNFKHTSFSPSTKSSAKYGHFLQFRGLWTVLNQNFRLWPANLLSQLLFYFFNLAPNHKYVVFRYFLVFILLLKLSNSFICIQKTMIKI